MYVCMCVGSLLGPATYTSLGLILHKWATAADAGVFFFWLPSAAADGWVMVRRGVFWG